MVAMGIDNQAIRDEIAALRAQLPHYEGKEFPKEWTERLTALEKALACAKVGVEPTKIVCATCGEARLTSDYGTSKRRYRARLGKRILKRQCKVCDANHRVGYKRWGGYKKIN